MTPSGVIVLLLKVNIMWERIPFNGGVNYHNQTLTITSDCTKWVLTNSIGSIKYSYDTLAEAMDAAQYVEV